MYVRYAETARVNWTRNFAVYHDPAHQKQWLGLMGSTGIGLILKSIKVDYKFASYALFDGPNRGDDAVL